MDILKTPVPKDEPVPDQLVGGVMDYQGDDQQLV